MTRARQLRLLFVFILASCLQASPLAPGMKAVEEIRGRKFLRDVRNVTIDRSRLTENLRAQMQKGMPYSIAEWETVLRSLQLLDAGTGPAMPSLLALYESQVLAFYDPHGHTYYSIRQLPKLPPEVTKMADPKLLEETVQVHELTHALQDQHFDLGAKERALMRDTDANLAYHSVLEGEAVLVMVAHMLKKSGVELDEIVKDDSMVGMISNAAQVDGMIDPSTPKYFVEMMKFPYLDGLRFVVAAYRRGGWKALDAIHANPPRSTREVLHPEEYFAKSFKPEPFDTTKPATAISAEHLGEFHWRFLVGEENARGWVNDRAIVHRNGKVDVETKWESEKHATAFADAYAAFLAKRGVNATVAREGTIVKAAY